MTLDELRLVREALSVHEGPLRPVACDCYRCSALAIIDAEIARVERPVEQWKPTIDLSQFETDDDEAKTGGE